MSETTVSIPSRYPFAPQLTLDDQIRSENTHGADSDTRLGSSICGTKASEDNGWGTSHGTKEWLCISQFDNLEANMSLMWYRGVRRQLSWVHWEGVWDTNRVDRTRRHNISRFLNGCTISESAAGSYSSRLELISNFWPGNCGGAGHSPVIHFEGSLKLKLGFFGIIESRLSWADDDWILWWWNWACKSYPDGDDEVEDERSFVFVALSRLASILNHFKTSTNPWGTFWPQSSEN